MYITLRDGNWYANGYVIVGYKGIDYEIYDEEVYENNIDQEPIRTYDDCDSALTWVYNS